MSAFITFEGPDGCGKSSILKLVNKKLNEDAGIKTFLTREPGGSEIAEKIRNIILDVSNVNMDIKTETFLFAASRSQHLKDTIIPNLKAGKVVLCDRFLDSNLAYQGLARGVGLETVMSINKVAVGQYMPDLTILIDVDSNICLERIKKNNRTTDRLDLETLSFHKKVRDAYLKLSEIFNDRYVVLNGDRCLDDIVDDAYQVILNYLRNIQNG